jgi:hypothetical protein
VTPAGAAPPEPPEAPDAELDTLIPLDELEAARVIDEAMDKQLEKVESMVEESKRTVRKYTEEGDRLRDKYEDVRGDYEDFLDEYGILGKKFIEIRIDGEGIRATDELGEEFLFSEFSRSFRGDRGEERLDEIRDRLRGIGQGDEAIVEFGDVYIDFDDEVDGDIVAIQGDIFVDGFVNGDLFSTGTVTLGPDAVVTGKIIAKRLNKKPGAELDGGFEEVDISIFPDLHRMMRVGLPGLFTWTITTGYMMAISLILLLLFKKPISRIHMQMKGGFFKNFFVGLLVILSIGPFFVLLCITIIGLPVAILIYPFVLIAAFALAFVGAACYAGQLAGRLMDSLRSDSVYLTALIGIVAMMALWLISGFFSTVGVGALSGVAFGFGVAVIATFFTAGIGAIWFSRLGFLPRDVDSVIDVVDTDSEAPRTDGDEAAQSPDTT